MEALSKQNEELMKQLKDSMDKETKYTQIIHSLTVQTSSSSIHQQQRDTNNHDSKSNDDYVKKGKRRDRSLSSSAVPDNNTKEPSNTKSTSKLPNIPFHRHNLIRAYHCFD